MIPCPSCQQPVEILEKHLGTLFTCPHCNAVYFIDWSGQPETAQHEQESDFQGGADFQAGTEFQPPPQQDFSSFNGSHDYAAPMEPAFGGEIPQEVPEEMAPQEDPYLTPADVIPPGTEIEIPVASEEEAQGEVPYDFGQTLDSVNAPEPMSSGTPDTADFSDVTDFANANTSAGPLTYSVVIEGIESSHLLMQLKEAMTDSRFGWDVTSLLAGVGGGRLVLRGLSPAKASVLINRIKYLPCKISWRQDVLSGS